MNSLQDLLASPRTGYQDQERQRQPTVNPNEAHLLVEHLQGGLLMIVPYITAFGMQGVMAFAIWAYPPLQLETVTSLLLPFQTKRIPGPQGKRLQ